MEIETRHLKAKASKKETLNCYARQGRGSKLSEEERREDALALRADERRDKLRKAVGSCK